MGDTDMAFRTHPELTVPTVLLHLLLNVSSFAFALPQKRIKEGTRMWPESRIHTLCFVSRSFAILLWAWFETHVLVSGEPHYWVNTVIVMANFVAVDYGSSTVKHPSQTIRHANAPAPLKFFFSMMQFWATANCLMGFRQRISMQFFAVFVMQITAFITTLRRKNIVQHWTVVVLYALQLGLAVFMGRSLVDRTQHPLLYEQFMMNRSASFLVGSAAAIIRMMPVSSSSSTMVPILNKIQSKYVLWALMSLWCYELRKTVYKKDDALWTREQLERATMASSLALTLFAFYQVNYGYHAISYQSKTTKQS